jgi:hypothetical protein
MACASSGVDRLQSGESLSQCHARPSSQAYPIVNVSPWGTPRSSHQRSTVASDRKASIVAQV